MWNQTYGGTDYDVAYSLVETSDGGFALAGKFEDDFWLVKTDASGNMEWNQNYYLPHSNIARALVKTSDGGYAIAGYTYSFDPGSHDFWLVKTDASGNMEWNQTYGGTDTEQAFSLVETSDGGFAIAGDTGTLSMFGTVGDSDFWLVKTDASGNMEWNQTYGGTQTDGAYSLVVTPDGGFAIAGFTNSFGAGAYDFWLVKTDASGNMEWTQTYGRADYEQARSLVVTSDGGFALAGETKSFGDGPSDYWLVKTDGSGNEEWNQTYGGPEHERSYSLVVTSDGGFALAGETESFGAGAYDFWLVKTDEYGVIPEFPSWVILPLFITATIVVLTCRIKLKDKTIC